MFKPIKVGDYSFSFMSPELTVGVPLFNRGPDVASFLRNIVQSVTSPFILLLCDDSSSDDTLIRVNEFFSSLHYSGNLVEVQIYSSPVQRFESYLDNFMLDLTKTDYFIEIQADMIISELGFDQKLVQAASTYSDLIALSGRGCHTFLEVQESFSDSLNTPIAQSLSVGMYLYLMIRRITKRFLLFCFGRSRVENQTVLENVFSAESYLRIDPNNFILTGRAGRIDQLADVNFNVSDLAARKIYVGDTVMRGPLLIDVLKYRMVGGFDLKAFFLGYDEHDLFLRAFLLHGYRVGFVPVGYSSQQENGSTRKSRSIFTELAIFVNILKRVRNYGMLGDCRIVSNKPEIREF